MIRSEVSNVRTVAERGRIQQRHFPDCFPRIQTRQAVFIAIFSGLDNFDGTIHHNQKRLCLLTFMKNRCTCRDLLPHFSELQ